jgi:hypothetical protein
MEIGETYAERLRNRLEAFTVEGLLYLTEVPIFQ